jgi:hypothetical protein
MRSQSRALRQGTWKHAVAARWRRRLLRLPSSVSTTEPVDAAERERVEAPAHHTTKSDTQSAACNSLTAPSAVVGSGYPLASRRVKPFGFVCKIDVQLTSTHLQHTWARSAQKSGEQGAAQGEAGLVACVAHLCAVCVRFGEDCGLNSGEIDKADRFLTQNDH